MSLEYLGLEMDKLIELRCGDWSASTLSDEQVAYAACDAIASIFIYHKVRKLVRNNFFHLHTYIYIYTHLFDF